MVKPINSEKVLPDQREFSSDTHAFVEGPAAAELVKNVLLLLLFKRRCLYLRNTENTKFIFDWILNQVQDDGYCSSSRNFSNSKIPA